MINWSQMFMGMSLFSCLLVVVFIWDAVWKFVGMWKAARKRSLVWFIVLGVVNTIGILPILYLYVFSKMKPRQREEEKPQRRHRRKSTSRRKRR